MPRDQFVADRGEPSPELLAAVADRQAWQARNGEHWTRTIPTGDDDAA